jgi:antitoxin (DNA-binding transcriptional repressor) of toxin-antitoxin stability system
LLARVEQGEDVVIARNGKPVARLTRIAAEHKRVPGSWRTLPGWSDFTYDPSIFAPMTDAEMASEGWL